VILTWAPIKPENNGVIGWVIEGGRVYVVRMLAHPTIKVTRVAASKQMRFGVESEKWSVKPNERWVKSE